MGQDTYDIRSPVQPAASQDSSQYAGMTAASYGTQQRSTQMIVPDKSLVLSGTGQKIPFCNVQTVGSGGTNQNHVVQKALRSDTNCGVYSDNCLPIPARSGDDQSFSELDMRYSHTLSESSATLEVNMPSQNTLPATTTNTVVLNPMEIICSPLQSAQNVVTAMSPPNSQPQVQLQQHQIENHSLKNEAASQVVLTYGAEEMDAVEGAMATDASGVPQFNHCPTGTGSGSSNGNTSGGSQAESGNGGQSHYVTGYSLQNCGSSMVTGGNGGGGLGGGGDDDPSKNNRHLQRSHYTEGNVFGDSDSEDFARNVSDPCINARMEELGCLQMPFLHHLEPSEISNEFDNLPRVEPMEESSDLASPLSVSVPVTPVPATAIAIPVSESISSSLPVHNRPSELVMQRKSSAGSHMSYYTSTPQLSYPIQVSTPQRQQPILPVCHPQQQRERSMPPPSPAPPPTPANVCLFDCRRFEENGKIYLELLVRKDLPADELQFTLKCFFHSVQFCMDIGEIMRDPCDLKVSNHVCATIADFHFDSDQSKLVFSIPADCKHVNQWLAEKGMEASFLDRSAVLQQVLNTLATIHNNGRDKSLWGAFQVFVAPDLRVYIVPDVFPMLRKMHAPQDEDRGFKSRIEDIKAISELYEVLIPPAIKQNNSCIGISPGVIQLLQAFDCVIQDRSSSSRMPDIARIFGGKRICRVDIDCFGRTNYFKVFCVEQEPVLTALSSIMPPNEGEKCVWLPSCQPVAIQDQVIAIRPMRLKLP